MRQCSVCHGEFPNFMPLPTIYVDMFRKLGVSYSLDDFETLNVGQYSCPSCQASDRDRLYALFIHRHLGWEGERMRILDIAPAPALSRFLRNLPEVDYRSCDLMSPRADDKVDITDMPYEDGRFDFIVCSHVLEHVADDAKAISELYRVLSPGGVAILMVPILMTATDTDEDPQVTDVNERWRRFGQDDHIRMYAKDDFIQRLQAGGFALQLLDRHAFAEGDFKQHGIGEGAVLYLGLKPEAAPGEVQS